MAEDLIISVSGLRGIVGQNLTSVIACEYGCAFGSYLYKCIDKASQQTVCIGRDSRTSGQMIFSSVTAGLTSVGIDVVDLGIVTTPGASIMVKELRCDGGVVITASHNPIPYNGIKLLLNNGMAPPLGVANQIKELFINKDFKAVDSVSCGHVYTNDLTDAVHIAKVLAFIDQVAISSRKLKVVLDSVNGAGGRVTKRLLGELGCEVIAIADEPTGIFAHEPEPTEANLRELCRAVKENGADIGFAQDPDADRLAIVDNTGRYLGEEYTLALAAKLIFNKNKGAKAATNLSTSRMIDDIADEAAGQVIRTPVGEANVAGAMLVNQCVIGGEGNGGVIDMRVGPVRDSLVGIGLVLQLIAQSGKNVGRLADEIGGYYMVKDKFTANDKQAEKILALAQERFVKAKLNTADGLRIDFDDGWIHLRSSNTEPVMRVIIEGKDEAVTSRYIDAVSEIRGSVLG